MATKCPTGGDACEETDECFQLFQAPGKVAMTQRRCFILGAGFSKCCGLPLASELTPIVWRARARKASSDDSPRPELVKPGDFGFESVKAEHDTIKLLFPSRECDPERDETWPNFELLITALDESARYQDAFERITGQATTNGSRHSKQALLRHLGERLSHLTNVAPAEGLKAIESFIDQLELQDDSVISFNWDVLLEIASANRGVAVSYRDDQRTGLRLAKPHGSLNLVDSSAAEYEDVKGRINNVRSLDTELEYKEGEPRIVLRARDPADSWLRQEWARERLLVEPNIRKSYDAVWLDLQWVRALRMVRGADRLIVIGFSLPEADLRPRLLLQLSRIQRPQAPPLVIVTPDAVQLCDHYRQLTGFEAEPFAGTLEDWLA